MANEFAQFTQTFTEESLESLQGMESILLHMNLNNIDEEEVNFMFRAMHSMKSNSDIFGYQDITKFTHGIEGFFDLVRSGLHQLTQNDVNLLLKSVDCLRSIMICIQEKSPIDYSCISDLNGKLSNIKNQDDKNVLLPLKSETNKSEMTKKKYKKIKSNKTTSVSFHIKYTNLN